MSSILKALEKVEESQNSKRPGGAAGLARRRERRPAWLIPAWAVGGAAVASLVTFAVMGGFSPSPAPTAQPAAAALDPLPVAVTLPTPVATVPAAAPAAAPAQAEPATRNVEAPVPAAASVPAPKAAAKTGRVAPAAAAKPAAAGPVTVPDATTEAEPVPAAQSQEALSEQPRQEIRVTGIAWQGNSESSFAMVNGRAIRQGGTVDGFKVERILEDSVSFSGSNGSITVPLGAGE